MRPNLPGVSALVRRFPMLGITTLLYGGVLLWNVVRLGKPAARHSFTGNLLGALDASTRGVGLVVVIVLLFMLLGFTLESRLVRGTGRPKYRLTSTLVGAVAIGFATALSLAVLAQCADLEVRVTPIFTLGRTTLFRVPTSPWWIFAVFLLTSGVAAASLRACWSRSPTDLEFLRRVLSVVTMALVALLAIAVACFLGRDYRVHLGPQVHTFLENGLVFHPVLAAPTLATVVNALTAASSAAGLWLVWAWLWVLRKPTSVASEAVVE